MVDWCLGFGMVHNCKTCGDSKICVKEYRPLVEKISELSQKNDLLRAEKDLIEAQAKLDRIKYINNLKNMSN